MASRNLSEYHSKMQKLREAHGGKCVMCGTNNNLHFDHIDPTTKVAGIADIVFDTLTVRGIYSGSTGAARLENELLKCQLLCGTCHNAKTLKQQGREAKHGTKSKYNKGCKCVACTRAAADYQRQRLEKRRQCKLLVQM